MLTDWKIKIENKKKNWTNKLIFPLRMKNSLKKEWLGLYIDGYIHNDQNIIRYYDVNCKKKDSFTQKESIYFRRLIWSCGGHNHLFNKNFCALMKRLESTWLCSIPIYIVHLSCSLFHCRRLGHLNRKIINSFPTMNTVSNSKWMFLIHQFTTIMYPSHSQIDANDWMKKKIILNCGWNQSHRSIKLSIFYILR